MPDILFHFRHRRQRRFRRPINLWQSWRVNVRQGSAFQEVWPLRLHLTLIGIYDFRWTFVSRFRIEQPSNLVVRAIGPLLSVAVSLSVVVSIVVALLLMSVWTRRRFLSVVYETLRFDVVATTSRGEKPLPLSDCAREEHLNDDPHVLLDSGSAALQP